MLKKYLIIILLLITSSGAYAYKGSTVTEEGAWCWFADPRAVHYENTSGTINSTYIGYIDVHGNIKATQVDHITNTTNEVLIRSYFQPDDHDNPTFLVLPDERIMIFYSRHTDEPCFYYRISQKPGDITTLGKEIRLTTKNNTTYPSPFILSDDPNHIYLCWRGIGWHPTIARMTMPDKEDKVSIDWGAYQIVRSRKGQGGTRPYAKYVSNGKDKIYLAYTTTHPDNQSINYIYLNYIDINTKELKDIKGNTLAIVGDSVLHDVDATKEYKKAYPYAVADDTPGRNWLWEVVLDKKERPVIAEVTINEDKSLHDYYRLSWTGKAWQKTFLTHAGGHFHQTPNIEKCYSGGMAIDKNNDCAIYASVPVDGKYGRVYELKKYMVHKKGKLVSSEQITVDSKKNNARPFMIANRETDAALVWMYGDYYDWMVSSSRPQGYPTAIHTDMPLPTKSINLDKGLIAQAADGNTTKVSKSSSFSLIMTVYMDKEQYFGNMVQFAGLSYVVPNEIAPKPYIQSNDEKYQSTSVLGSSDVWQQKGRSTGGQWYAPTKFGAFDLAITYNNGILRTYINGLIDQYIEIDGLTISDVSFGDFKERIKDFKVYNRVLNQDEIKKIRDNSSR
ncbi:MAG: BNR-4 repeat-containing protein [Mangrovibacterium sp.]